jgi:hypothetical protein
LLIALEEVYLSRGLGAYDGFAYGAAELYFAKGAFKSSTADYHAGKTLGLCGA